MFLQNTVVFVGVSADDDGASGMLRELISVNIDAGPHFWLTDRTDGETDKWCEENHVLAIRYNRSENPDSHLQAVTDLVNAVSSYQPTEPFAPPVTPSSISANDQISTAEDLARLEDIDQIRLQLSSYANYILSKNITEERKEDQYINFFHKYKRAIHTSWLVEDSTDGCQLFGYNVNRKIKSGAFGDIYEASRENGDQVAIKILRQEIQDDVVMTKSFRRGIQSMRILTQGNLKGCVRLYDAYELPPCIVMEYINGHDLGEAVDANLITGYRASLEVCLEVAKIVEAGHRLRERVLHRDLRPANIMIDNVDYDAMTFDVRVLDFDLSWHKGAWDRSISSTAHSALGFLAPEQTMQMGKDKTRSTLVDSHGLGATLFFMLSKGVPDAGYFYRENHSDTILGQLPDSRMEKLHCLKHRCHRLICSSTSFEQKDRIDFSSLRKELETLVSTLGSSDFATDENLIAEEILCRGVDGLPYSYDVENGKFIAKLRSGVSISSIPDYESRKISLEVSYAFEGDRDWKNVKKYLGDSFLRCKSNFEKLGWKTSSISGSDKDRRFDASSDSHIISENMTSMASAITAAIGTLNFD